MKPILRLVLIAALAAPLHAMACAGDQEPQIRQHTRFYPLVGDKTSHWPSEVKAAIGSYTSFMVPIDTKIEIQQRQAGTFSPLTLLDEVGSRDIRSSRYLVPAWVDIEHDAKKFKWVHFGASGYGTSVVRMRSPSGWSKSIRFTLVYPSETDQAARPPVQLILDGRNKQTVRVDAYDNIEVTVAGNVSDGWRASPAAETGFELIRIQQVEKTYSGAHDLQESKPRVKLFFASTRNPQNATMILRQGSGFFGKTIKFKIEAEPTPVPSCAPVVAPVPVAN